MVTLIFLACTKQGPAGAADPQGPSGVPGTTGPAGPGGSKGDTGRANVIYSKWDSSIVFTLNGNIYVGTWIIPQITQSIINSGVVLVYFRPHNVPEVEQLNYYTGQSYISYNIFPGQIFLTTTIGVATGSVDLR